MPQRMEPPGDALRRVGALSGLFRPCCRSVSRKCRIDCFSPRPARCRQINLLDLPPSLRTRLGVVNSGFGFQEPRKDAVQNPSRAVYLGTVEFVKMHPAFFEIVDAVGHKDFRRRDLEEQFDSTANRRHARPPSPAGARLARRCARGSCSRCCPEAGILVLSPAPTDEITAAAPPRTFLSKPCRPGVAPLVRPIRPRWPSSRRRPNRAQWHPTTADAAIKLAWMLDHPEQVSAMGRAAAATVARTPHPVLCRRRRRRATQSCCHSRNAWSISVNFLAADAARWFLGDTDCAPATCSRSLISRRPARHRRAVFAHFLACMPEDATAQITGKLIRYHLP